MTTDADKELVRQYMKQYTKPAKPHIWVGEPYGIDELGFSIEAGIYGDNESPQAHTLPLGVDLKTRTVAWNIIG